MGSVRMIALKTLTKGKEALKKSNEKLSERLVSTDENTKLLQAKKCIKLTDIKRRLDILKITE